MMRMHAGRARQELGTGAPSRGPRPGYRAAPIGAGDDLAGDTRGRGGRNDLRAIIRETLVREIGSDIDQFHVQAPLSGVYGDYMMRRMPLLRRLVLAPLCAAALSAQAQLGGDLQARIVYAFHAEDASQLATLIQTLDTRVQGGGTDVALRYHLAHAKYRFGLLAAPAQAKEAEEAFKDCTQELKAVLVQDANSAEAMALQSACYSNLARLQANWGRP